MTRWFALLLLFTCLATVTACGDDDDSASGTPTVAAQEGDGSPEARYFVAWKAIHKDVNDRIAANSAAYPGAFEGDLEDTKASFPIYVDLFDEFRERVGELDTPSSLQAVVDDAVTADEAISAIHHQRAELLADATSYGEVEEIFADNRAFTAANNDSTAACEAFQAKGVEHGIAFERECGS